MTSYTSSCYPIAVQSVRDAILKDTKGETKEALCNYVSCMLFMLQALKNEAWEKRDVSEVCSEETNKLIKMTDQCLGRVKDILRVKKDQSSNSDTFNSRIPPPISPVITSKPNAGRRVSEPPLPLHLALTKPGGSGVASHLAKASTLLTTLPSPPGARKTSTSNFQNVNQERFQAYQRRKTLRGVTNINVKYNTTSYNLHLFRKQAEKKALTIAREKVVQQRWMERQNEIKMEAERRFNLRNNRSQRDKEYRQNLLVEILAYEEQTNWPVGYRDSLKKDALDIQSIINVVQAVLRCKDHPLCKVCKGLQYVVYQKVVDILDKSEDNGQDYLTPVETMPRNSPKIPLSSKVSSTGQRDKRYSVCSADETTVDFDSAQSIGSNGNAVHPGTTKGSVENISTNDPVQVNTEKNSPQEESKDFTDSQTNTLNQASAARLKYASAKVDSFEKLYDDLEDAIFSSSDSEDGGGDADDEAEFSNLETISPEPKTVEEIKKSIETDSNSTLTLDQPSNNQGESTDTKWTVSSSKSDKTSKNNNKTPIIIKDDKTELDSDTEPSRDESTATVSESSNPAYFSASRINLKDNIKNRTTCKQINIDDHLYDLPCDPDTKENDYEFAWGDENINLDGDTESANITRDVSANNTINNQDDDNGYEVSWDKEKNPEINSKNVKKNRYNDIENKDKSDDDYDEPWGEITAPVIQVHSPSTPKADCTDGTTSPLPNRYSSEGEYSDLGEQFKESVYDNLNSPGEESNSKNSNKSQNSGSHKSLKSPDYYDLEADDTSSIGNDYEVLSFDGTEENIYEQLDTLDKKTSGNDSPICSEEQEDRYRGANDRFPIDTFYLKKLDGIIQEIRFGIDRLHSVLLLAYEDLDTPIGRDQSYATLESLLFQPLWGWLIQVFRKMNAPKETYLKELMVQYQHCKPQDLKVREKFSLLDQDDPTKVPYEEAIREIKQIATLKCPLDKLECLVRMSKAICHCVEVYWLKKGGNSPSVGCDDLLPIVAYVITQTNYPQIVSECHAMEEFIHEGYLMGEEGYCLTTLHAALTHLLTLPAGSTACPRDTRLASQ